MKRLVTWFEKLIDPFPIEEAVQPPHTIVAFCWHYSKGIWPILAFMCVCAAVIALLEVVMFSYVGNVVDWLSHANKETFLQDNKPLIILMSVVSLIVFPLIVLLWSLLFHQTILGNYPMLIRWQAHRYVLNQSMPFYQDEFAGRVATKVMQAALGVRETVVKILDVFIYVAVYFLGAVVLVAQFNFWLMLPFIVWIVFYLLAMWYFLPKMAKISRLQADARSDMTGRIVDSYSNITTVKLFAHAGGELSYARSAMQKFLDTVYPQMRLSTGLEFFHMYLNQVLMFSVAAVAVVLWLNGQSTIAGVAVALALVVRLMGMSHWIMWELLHMFENIGMTIDGMNTIARETKVKDSPNAKQLSFNKGEIVFEKMDFQYDKHGHVIDNMNLTIQPGEKIGLIGRSGAGKTTMMNVLLRLYDVDGGKVLIDGQNIADVTQESLRSHIAVVTQDTSLLHRSVRENIAYGRPNASDEDIIAAAKQAKAHEFILELEDSEGRTAYDVHVGERGVKLSGGQRQRIAIARVFLKDAPILILDEATSALDSEVETIIQEHLFTLMEGKTVLAIAHRLSTIANMDRLVVLDKGRIVEEGSHEALLKNKALYASLWNRQSGNFMHVDD